MSKDFVLAALDFVIMAFFVGIVVVQRHNDFVDTAYFGFFAGFFWPIFVSGYVFALICRHFANKYPRWI